MKINMRRASMTLRTPSVERKGLFAIPNSRRQSTQLHKPKIVLCTIHHFFFNDSVTPRSKANIHMNDQKSACMSGNKDDFQRCASIISIDKCIEEMVLNKLKKDTPQNFSGSKSCSPEEAQLIFKALSRPSVSSFLAMEPQQDNSLSVNDDLTPRSNAIYQNRLSGCEDQQRRSSKILTCNSILDPERKSISSFCSNNEDVDMRKELDALCSTYKSKESAFSFYPQRQNRHQSATFNCPIEVSPFDPNPTQKLTEDPEHQQVTNSANIKEEKLFDGIKVEASPVKSPSQLQCKRKLGKKRSKPLQSFTSSLTFDPMKDHIGTSDHCEPSLPNDDSSDSNWSIPNPSTCVKTQSKPRKNKRKAKAKVKEEENSSQKSSTADTLKPKSEIKLLPCPHCGKKFSAQGLGGHKAKAHHGMNPDYEKKMMIRRRNADNLKRLRKAQDMVRIHFNNPDMDISKMPRPLVEKFKRQILEEEQRQ